VECAFQAAQLRIDLRHIAEPCGYRRNVGAAIQLKQQNPADPTRRNAIQPQSSHELLEIGVAYFARR
jgi:hypothetical protein